MYFYILSMKNLFIIFSLIITICKSDNLRGSFITYNKNAIINKKSCPPASNGFFVNNNC